MRIIKTKTWISFSSSQVIVLLTSLTCWGGTEMIRAAHSVPQKMRPLLYLHQFICQRSVNVVVCSEGITSEIICSITRSTIWTIPRKAPKIIHKGNIMGRKNAHWKIMYMRKFLIGLIEFSRLSLRLCKLGNFATITQNDILFIFKINLD